MSLQIWLPLNGSLENKGLDTCNISGTGVYDNTGKIGKCLKTSNSITITPKSNITTESLSFSCWIKSSTVSSSSTVWWRFFKISYTDGTSHNLYTADSGNGRYKWESAPSYNLYCNTQVWHHIVYILKGNTLYGYLDGKLIGSSTETNTIRTVQSFVLGSNSDVYLNDVRIYDHCLSAKEVKEISKGLVLHYPLNQPERSTNLLKRYIKQGSRTTRIDDNKIRIGTSSDSGDTYFYLRTSVQLVADEIYTLSCDASGVPDGTNWNFGLQNNGKFQISINKNGRCIITAKWYQTINADTDFLFDDLSKTLTCSLPSDIYLSNFKLEKGENKNPVWTPYADDTIDWGYTEYDTSGYNNNGVTSSSTSPIWNNASPRYNGCYNFDTASKKIYVSNLITTGFSNSYTFTWWSISSDFTHSMPWGFYDGNYLNFFNGLYCNTGDSDRNPFVDSSGATIKCPSTNIWHFYAMTGDGTKTLLYVDGKLYGTAKTYRPITGSSIYLNGWDSSNNYPLNGSMSDFRIYATVLSNDDILELYNAPEAITKNGAIMAYDFISSDDTSSVSVNKTGVVKSNFYNESDGITSVSFLKTGEVDCTDIIEI